MCQKFDFPNTAAPQFDVVAAFRVQSFLTDHIGTDLLVQVADRVDNTEVKVAAVDERMHDASQCFDIFGVAGNGACLDPCIAFPFASLYDQILFDHTETGHERTGCPIGTQCHIHPECETVFGDFGKCADKTFAESCEKFLVGKQTLSGTCADRIPVFRIHENQIDIR